MLNNDTKSVVITSVMVLVLLAVMIPVTQATSTPVIDKQIDSLPEMITMEQLLELTGCSLVDPTEEYMATLNGRGEAKEAWESVPNRFFFDESS